jgi:ABC-type Mn2+/Zn2+ transport system permease subunit
MRRRFWRPGDRAIGIVLGVVLGIAVIILFLFLSSRNTIDEPSLSGGATTQTQTQPAPPPAKVTGPKAKPSQ